MAERTALSRMPRRRNCFSIISARCGAYSRASSMRSCRRVLFPRAGLQNLLHLREGEVALFVAILKMRRNAHAGFGTVIDKNVACQKLAANFVRVGAFDRNGSGALRPILRRVDFPSACLRPLDEPRGQ